MLREGALPQTEPLINTLLVCTAEDLSKTTRLWRGPDPQPRGRRGRAMLRGQAGPGHLLSAHRRSGPGSAAICNTEGQTQHDVLKRGPLSCFLTQAQEKRAPLRLMHDDEGQSKCLSTRVEKSRGREEMLVFASTCRVPGSMLEIPQVTALCAGEILPRES